MAIQASLTESRIEMELW